MDPYQTLGISCEALDETVQRAFRELALKHHPDHNPHDGDAPRRFREIMAAYEAIRAMRSQGEPFSRLRSVPRGPTRRAGSREIEPEARASVHRSLLRLLAAIDSAVRSSTSASITEVVDRARWCKLETDLALGLKGHVDPLRDAEWSSFLYQGPADAARIIVRFRRLAEELSQARLDLVELRNLRARLEGLIAVLAGLLDELA
jgi:hypothetical protein